MAGLLKPVPGTITNGFAGATNGDAWLSKDGWRASETQFSGAVYHANLHRALDISCAVGTPVVAPETMLVRWIARDDIRGLYVRAEIQQGTIMDFLHLSHVCVEPGDIVKRDKVFCLSDESGEVSGPHLHWSLLHTSSDVASYRSAHDWTYVYNPAMALVGGSHASEPWLLP